MFKNPCEGLKVNTDQHDLSDMFIDTLSAGVGKDREYTKKLFGIK